MGNRTKKWMGRGGGRWSWGFILFTTSFDILEEGRKTCDSRVKGIKDSRWTKGEGIANYSQRTTIYVDCYKVVSNSRATGYMGKMTPEVKLL